MPRAPPLILDGGWLASILGSSSSGESPLIRAPREAWPAAGRAPAPSPLLKGGEPLRAPSASPVVEYRVGSVLRSAHERSVVLHELFRDAMGAMNRLGEELADVDTCLVAEGLRLMVEQHKLKVAINLGRHQRELDNAIADASLATTREACS